MYMNYINDMTKKYKIFLWINIIILAFTIYNNSQFIKRDKEIRREIEKKVIELNTRISDIKESQESLSNYTHEEINDLIIEYYDFKEKLKNIGVIGD